MELLLQKFVEWGPGGLLAAFFGFLWLKERDRCDAATARIHDLQEKRLADTREDLGKMSGALASSTMAIGLNTSSIATLTKIVETRTERSGS